MSQFTVDQIADEFGHDSLDDCFIKAIESIEFLQKSGTDPAMLLSIRQRVQALYFDAILKIMAA